MPKCVSKFLLDMMKMLLNFLVAISIYVFFTKTSRIYIFL